jgi:hypothetical protein
MQNYVLGILTSLFILDIIKLNYEKSHQPHPIQTETIEGSEPTPPLASGIKVQSDDGSEIKVEYEGRGDGLNYDSHTPLQIKILYW